MADDLLRFTVTRLSATVPDGVPITWRGKAFDSGPLTIELCEGGDGTANHGVLDYARRRARAEFHVQLGFPEFAEILRDLGVDPALTEPVKAVLRSEGDILDDHSFVLSGVCDVAPHDLVPRETTTAAVLPGR
jgi:hypothetical protein